jgi:hypothetical protein
MLTRLLRNTRCLFCILFYGMDETDLKECHEALEKAHMRNKASRNRLAHVMGELFQNLDYDRVVKNDGVVPMGRMRG